MLSAQQQTARVTLRRRGEKHRCFYGDRGLKSYCTSVKESARMLDCLLIKERTGTVFVRVCLSYVAMVIRSGQCQERLESRGQAAESTFKRLLTNSARMNLFKNIRRPSRLWEQIRKMHVKEFFFIWMWALRYGGVTCCTDCEALWGKFVILGYINEKMWFVGSRLLSWKDQYCLYWVNSEQVIFVTLLMRGKY